MNNKKTLRNNLIAGAILAVLIVAFAVLMYGNYRYNKTERVGKLDESSFDGTDYIFKELKVNISTRGGDSGAWIKDPITDEDGNELHGQSVGTIYEALVTNTSKDMIVDWTLLIPINEMMWVNNNWDSEMEIHQDVNGEEKVLSIDLSDYSEYDINLDYYIDHTGPMIPLYEGDYFIYHPEESQKEKPISPSKNQDVGEGAVRFGYIMYIPDQGLDYVADFSGGEIHYYMHRKPTSQPWFWIIILLVIIWMIWLIISVVVHIRMQRVLAHERELREHREQVIKQTMELIINMIESKDTNTKGHSIRVAEYSKLLAKHMGLPKESYRDVYYIGMMHDCGKMKIPNEILLNPGKLTPEEYETMKQHTIYGAQILKNFTSVEDIDVGAKYHHERYDGKGYPNGLAGEDIPLVARIVGVADAFDAMNSKRCYRDRLPADQIIKELKDNRGKQFDPVVVDHMLALIAEGEVHMD